MRLIDADRLNDAMYHEAFETDSKMQKWDSGCWIRYKMFENHLDEAPTIEQPTWIPCSERMPEEDGDYLVSLAFEWGNEIEMGWLLDGEWVNPNSHVTVAWMPLPKPWKGAGDD